MLIFYHLAIWSVEAKTKQIRHKNTLKRQNFRLEEALVITLSISLTLQMRKLSPEILDNFHNVPELVGKMETTALEQL